MGRGDYFFGFLTEAYNGILGFFPEGMRSGILVFLFALLIALSAVFIWYFYKSLSKRSLIELNLSQYNTSQHPVFSKVVAVLLYLAEYLILMPVLIFVWFVALSVFILLVAEGRAVSNILMLTGAMVAAIRILAYYEEEIAQDLAKLFPFITLSVLLLAPGALNFEEVLLRATELPSLFSHVFSFLIVIVIIEIILRLIYTGIQFANSKKISS